MARAFGLVSAGRLVPECLLESLAEVSVELAVLVAIAGLDLVLAAGLDLVDRLVAVGPSGSVQQLPFEPVAAAAVVAAVVAH